LNAIFESFAQCGRRPHFAHHGLAHVIPLTDDQSLLRGSEVEPLLVRLRDGDLEPFAYRLRPLA
jgi:hypothetical protein